jgi:hypothetical protein
VALWGGWLAGGVRSRRSGLLQVAKVGSGKKNHNDIANSYLPSSCEDIGANQWSNWSKKNHTVVPNSYLQFCLARFIPKCLEPCLNGGRTGSKKNHTVVPNSYLHVGICQVLFGALHHQNALNFT